MRRLALALVMASLAGCSLTPSEEDPVEVKLRDLDARLSRIERASEGLVSIAQRLDANEADVRTLRGRIDELQNGTEALRKQQRDLYTDLDKRIGAGAVAPPPGSTYGGTTGAAGTAAGEQAAYSQAFDALKAANYGGAISGFQQFLSAYPSSDLADNAQYWLGEAYYVTRDYEKAAAAFRTVGERWPQSRKSADALLKLGFSQYELKQYSDARNTLTDVTRRFSGTDAARLASDRLQRMPATAR
jgi:tol-pal system protein YbgF